MRGSTGHTAVSVVIALSLWAVCVRSVSAITFATLDAPLGALGTYPSGVSGNKVVGYFQDASYQYHGFLHDGSTWLTLNAPNAAYRTVARAISGNNIVGYFQDASGSLDGFVYDGTSWTTLNDPAAARAGYGIGDTAPTGIDGGNIVGIYGPGSGGRSGFLYDGSTWTSLAYPGADFTYATGTSGGNVVGFYQNYVFGALRAHGFEFNGSTWTTLDDPSANTPTFNGDGTYINGIFGRYIVGGFQVSHNGNQEGHGFLYDGSTWTTIDEPLSSSLNNGTSVTGIYGNTIIGYYYDGVGFNYPHGFIATVPEPSTFALMLIAAVVSLALRWRPRRASA